MNEVLDCLPKSYEDLTADEYLALDNNAKANIKRTVIIPSDFSSSDMGGRIRVFYYNPVYRCAVGDYK